MTPGNCPQRSSAPPGRRISSCGPSRGPERAQATASPSLSYARPNAKCPNSRRAARPARAEFRRLARREKISCL
jgi:hypothetical protein